MSTYKVSQDTKRALIQAAGELIAEHGLDSLSVRQITQRAHVKVNAISYHFGGKENFIQAVIHFALIESRSHRVTDYPLDNSHLFETPDGRRQLVTDLIDLFFHQLCSEGQPAWVNIISLRIAVTDHLMKEKILSSTFHPIRDVFMQVFERITGNTDPASALCWFLNIASAPILFATHLTSFSQSSTSKGEIDFTLYRRIQHTVTQNALFALGLIH